MPEKCSGGITTITKNTADYCFETVRKHDPDRFILTLLAPASARAALLALYAFNYEIAKTREVVTETQLGLIRLQWWRDALAGVYDGKPPLKHQVLEPLAAAITQYKLPRDLFDALIYGREFDLEDRLPATLPGMVNYADYTSTPLLRLSTLITGEKTEEGAVQRIGTAYALAGLLRAAPAHLVQRRCYLPEDLLHKQQTEQYALYEGKDLDKLKPVTLAVAAIAKEKLAGLPPQKGLMRIYAKMAAMYLDEIIRAGGNVYALRPPPFMALRLWWKNLF
ncbi:MAG: squalene/phytoene synthase family protein [Micavibrio sp.]|nr:squalene/phytoene synthase family protein [Micavibrio sp.]